MTPKLIDYSRWQPLSFQDALRRAYPPPPVDSIRPLTRLERVYLPAQPTPFTDFRRLKVA